VSRKSPKIAALFRALPPSCRDPRYAVFFECFNRGFYFEAHDILEELWLTTKGDPAGFYKGLIQLAGAFVHLSKSRSGPSLRLLRLAEANLAPHAPEHEGLDVAFLLDRVNGWVRRLEQGDPASDLCAPPAAPRIDLGFQPVAKRPGML
jgi:hypothetical protein